MYWAKDRAGLVAGRQDVKLSELTFPEKKEEPPIIIDGDPLATVLINMPTSGWAPMYIRKDPWNLPEEGEWDRVCRMREEGHWLVKGAQCQENRLLEGTLIMGGYRYRRGEIINPPSKHASSVWDIS